MIPRPRSASFCLLLVLAGLFSLQALAQDGIVNRQKIRPLADPVWADLSAILLDSGRVAVSPTAPYSDARILAEIDAIDPAKLSPPAQLARARLLSALAEKPRLRSGPLGASLGVDVSPALEWRSSKDSPWIRGYADRPPMINLPVELTFADSVYGIGGMAFTIAPHRVNELPEAGLGFNFAELLAAPTGIDGTFPFRAFGSVGGDWWNFQIGRDRLSFGNSGSYNLTISSAAEFYDFARLTLFSPSFAYSGLVIQLNPDRYLYTHRFDLRLGGGLALAVTESSLVGQAPLELRFFNPLMIFHGYQAWSDYEWATINYKDGSSNEVGLELNWSPLKGLGFSAQYQMNQVSDPLKKLFWSNLVSTIPDGISWLGSVDLRLPLAEAFIVMKIIGVYSTPLDYLSPWTAGDPVSQIGESPVTWIYDRPTKPNYSAPEDRSRAWIGFSEGPDTILGALSLGLDGAGAWALIGDATFKAQGAPLSKAAIDARDPALAQLRTPSGIAEYSLTTGVSARSFLALPLDFLAGNLSGALHWIGRWNAGHAEGIFAQSWELTLATTFQLR